MKTKRPFNASVFEEIGEPTLSTSAALRAIQSNCVKRKNQNSFYLTIDVRLPVSIFWQHNTDVHFRQPRLTFSGYFELIHPHWRPIYRRLTFAGHEIAKEMGKDGLANTLSYSGYIPMQQLDGSYSWYKLFVLPCTLDKHHNIVHHHHQYLRLGDFDKLFPSPSEIALGGVVDVERSMEMVLAAGDSMNNELKKILTTSSYRNLLAYRLNAEFTDGHWKPPSSSKMRDQLSLNQQALNKANTRILRAARVAFPKCTLNSVGGFAVFLNEIFGCPDKEN